NEDFVTNLEKLYATFPTELPNYGTFAKMMQDMPWFHFWMVSPKRTRAIRETKPEDDGLGDALQLRLRDVTQLELKTGDHILVMNNDEDANVRIARNIVYRLGDELDEVIVVNKYGRNNYP